MVVLLATLLLGSYSREFTLHRATDASTHEVAYRYLLPKGWSTTDAVTWNLNDKVHPMSFNSTMSSPDGQMTITMVPSETHMFQVQNGNLSGTLPPDTATKALDNVLAVSHPDLKNATLIVRKDFDVPTPMDGQGLKTKGMVGVLEVTFEQDGKQLTELLSVTEYEGSHQGDGGALQGIWMIGAGFTFTCVGQLTADEFKTFSVVAASQRLDPLFFATTMEVSKRQESGPVDLKAAAASVKGLDADSKTSYAQNLMVHAQSMAKLFPIYSGEREVGTYEGPIMLFKGLNIWMKKPDEYQVTDSSTPPGSGWESGKDVG